MVLIRIITKKDASELVEYLKSANFGVTSIEGHGIVGEVKVVFTVVPRREVQKVAKIIKKFNPKAFYSIEEVGFVERGIFPAKKTFSFFGLTKLFRPFRKGK